MINDDKYPKNLVPQKSMLLGYDMIEVSTHDVIDFNIFEKISETP